MTTERALEYRNVIAGAMQSVDDETAILFTNLFPKWGNNAQYKVGYKVDYLGTLYKVLQDHTSQSDWTPDVTPSLYAKVLIPDPTVIPEWEQPDSTNGYMTGDRVMYNGSVYESLIDNNVWSPEAYPAGWQIIE
jgi:hypothetical protein